MKPHNPSLDYMPQELTKTNAEVRNSNRVHVGLNKSCFVCLNSQLESTADPKGSHFPCRQLDKGETNVGKLKAKDQMADFQIAKFEAK